MEQIPWELVQQHTAQQRTAQLLALKVAKRRLRPFGRLPAVKVDGRERVVGLERPCELPL